MTNTDIPDLSPQDMQLKLHALRTKMLQGEELTLDESREGLDLIRKLRGKAAEAKPGNGTRTKVAKPNSDDLLKELGGLGGL